MKKLLFLLFVISVYNVKAQDLNEAIKIMSYNIRLDYHGDSINGDGWEQRRKEQVIELIEFYSPDLLGVQEAKKNQMVDLLNYFAGYDYIGVGRDDGKDGGEFSAILFKKDRFEVLEENTFWLSDTPEKPSKDWDAAYPRIVTWGKFRDKASGKDFYYYNTHFDHIGVAARAESARLILKKVDEAASNDPVIVSGDFNAIPAAETYKILSSSLKDAAAISKKAAYGPIGTFSGFDLKDAEDFPRIDYIFVDRVEVLSYETITDFVNNKFPSDHLPVMATVKVK